jgi:hypothetical protein
VTNDQGIRDGVLVPRSLLGGALSLLSEMTIALAPTGARLSPDAQRLLAGLDAVIRSDSGPVVATVTESPGAGFVPVAEAAHRAKRSERHVRRLAAAGKVRSRRVGARTLLVDLDGLINVLRRTTR